MAERNPHVIARQVLELAVPSVALASEVQEAAAQRFLAGAMSEIEALFDRVAGPGQLVRLERLELNLGDLCGANWQEQFESRLVAQLSDSLQHAAVNVQEHSFTPESGLGSDCEPYLYFLRHGRLPWWAEAPPSNWPQQMLQELDPAQWHTLSAVLARASNAQLRLIHTVDDITVASLLGRHARLPGLAQVFTLWRPAQLPAASHTAWRTQFWLAVLDSITAIGEHARGVEIMRRLLRVRSAFATPASANGSPPTTPGLPAPWQDWLAQAQRGGTPTSPSATDATRIPSPAADNAAPQPWESKASPVKTPAETPRARNAPLASAAPDAPEAASQSPSKPPCVSAERRDSPWRAGAERPGAAQSGTAPAGNGTAPEPPAMPFRTRADAHPARRADHPARAGEAVYLNGAGCVILHPFFEELFRSNALLDGRRFRDAAARERAVRLLAWLTFGDEATPEYELLLPKLLCGMAWEEPLAPIELSGEERASCDELLRAVLKHWNALKSNSTDWLRGQFFLRAAKLELLDENWRLTVERRAQDVLLDRLPWGLGVIDLPWRQGLIYVHWMN
ncbi:MAG TPA: contractile injection system tape measure protein [Gammaproteobacteria bacterium]